jgi:hypothetical protein
LQHLGEAEAHEQEAGNGKAVGAGKDGAGIKTGDEPIPPCGLAGEFGLFDAGEDFAGEPVEVAGGRLLVFFEGEQFAQIVEILIVVHLF